jgi:hypothetical protein
MTANDRNQVLVEIVDDVSCYAMNSALALDTAFSGRSIAA